MTRTFASWGWLTVGASGCVLVSPADVEDWRARHPEGANYAAVAAGALRNCAVTDQGALECWGGAADPDWPDGAWSQVAVESEFDDDVACARGVGEVRCWRPGQPDVASYPGAQDLDVNGGAVCGVWQGRVDCYGVGDGDDPNVRIGGEDDGSQTEFVWSRTRGGSWCGLTAAADVVCGALDGGQPWGAFPGPFGALAMGDDFVAALADGIVSLHGPAGDRELFGGATMAAIASDGCQVCGTDGSAARCESVGTGCADYGDTLAELGAELGAITQVALSAHHVCVRDDAGCVACGGEAPGDRRGVFGEPACAP